MVVLCHISIYILPEDLASACQPKRTTYETQCIAHARQTRIFIPCNHRTNHSYQSLSPTQTHVFCPCNHKTDGSHQSLSPTQTHIFFPCNHKTNCSHRSLSPTHIFSPCIHRITSLSHLGHSSIPAMNCLHNHKLSHHLVRASNWLHSRNQSQSVKANDQGRNMVLASCLILQGHILVLTSTPLHTHNHVANANLVRLHCLSELHQHNHTNCQCTQVIQQSHNSSNPQFKEFHHLAKLSLSHGVLPSSAQFSGL